MKTMLAAVAGALVATAGLALTAFHGGPFHHGRDPAEVAAFVNNRVEDALDNLDATPDQRTVIHGLASQLLTDVQAHRDARQATHQAFLDEWKSDHPNAARLHALVDQRAAEMTAVAHQAVDAAVKVHDTLTVAQRAKITKRAERWSAP
jgi:periplasmic protein CpxP/Spy